MKKINEHSLYLVISEEYGRGRSALDIAEDAIAGGVDIIQMREKKKGEAELVKLGKAIEGLCEKNDVTFIVNDDPFLAKDICADGVHLGQEDLSDHPLRKVRDLLGSDKIIGISTHSLEQFAAANEEDADYIAFGPIFPTKTKDYNIGTKDVKQVLRIARKPVFFIGGINLSNMDELLGKGAKNIALIRDICEAEDIASRTRQFKKKIAFFKKGG